MTQFAENEDEGSGFKDAAKDGAREGVRNFFSGFGSGLGLAVAGLLVTIVSGMLLDRSDH
jgi:hypothetical protein